MHNFCSAILLLVPLTSKTVLSLSVNRISHTRSGTKNKSLISTSTIIHHSTRSYNSKLSLFGSDQIQKKQVENIEFDKPQLSSLSSSEEEVKQPSTSNGKKSRTEKLRFGGKQNYTSRILPLPSNHQSLFHFFDNKDNQAVLLTGGKDDSTVEPIHLNSIEDVHLIDLWKINAKIMGAKEPNEETDQVMKVFPSKIRIITIQICPEAIIGTKLTTCDQRERTEGDGDRDDDSNIGPLPEFQAVLIEDDPKAIGPKPLVWLFNKIVYGSNPEDGNQKANLQGKRDRNEKALLRVWAERVSQSDDGTQLPEPSFVLKAESEMQLEFEFPRLLLKFFPFSKSKAEEITSAAITRELTANLEPAIDRFLELYIDEMNADADIR